MEANEASAGTTRFQDIVDRVRRKKSAGEVIHESTRQWGQPLERPEYPRLQELGLGVAVDITEKHPWIKKSAFQAKPVFEGTTDMDPESSESSYYADLIVINESNQFKKYSEVVDSFSEVQSALKSSFRPSPNQPIDVSIAADFHRSSLHKKSMKGETVLTRTIAFRVHAPIVSTGKKEKFEEQLNAWLEKQGCITHSSKGKDMCIPEVCKIPGYQSTLPSTVHSNQSAMPSDQSAVPSVESFWYYTPETNHMCIQYIRALGGVTHYVSSITLGATRYHVETEKLINLSLSQSAGVSADRFASGTLKVTTKKKKFISNSKTEAIGKIPPKDKDGNMEYTLQFRSVSEAVVRCSYTSLSNLVTHPHLQTELEAAIQEYIDFRLHGTRGPYYIATAERLPLNDKRTQPEASGDKSQEERGCLTEATEQRSQREKGGQMVTTKENSHEEKRCQMETPEEQSLKGKSGWTATTKEQSQGEKSCLVTTVPELRSCGEESIQTAASEEHSCGDHGGQTAATEEQFHKASWQITTPEKLSHRETSAQIEEQPLEVKKCTTIETAKEQPLRGRIYWRVKVDGEKYQVVGTSSPSLATNFYLKPLQEKYFVIATDPEDPRIAKQLDANTVHKTETTASSRASHNSHATRAYTRTPQRFIHVTEDNQLMGELVINWKMGAFKLRSPHDRKSYHPLSRSHWLPESTLGSQPYHIQLGESLFRPQRTVLCGDYTSGGNMPVTCQRSKDSRTHNQLFILEPGHPT